MKSKYSIFTAVLALLLAALTVPFFLPGCAVPAKNGTAAPPPPQSKPVWQEVKVVQSVRQPELGLEGGDIIMENFGNPLGFFPSPEDDRWILAVDWQNSLAGFYILDLYSRTVNPLGGIHLTGPAPVVADFSWPWVLLKGSGTSDANYSSCSWILVDISGEQPEIVWDYSASVPNTLRQPVWFSGETWYLGPVKGPVITDILSGKTIAGNQEHPPVNPVQQGWPGWAGGVTDSNWFMYPLEGGGAALLNLDNGSLRVLDQDQELVWNGGRTQLAWCQEDQLGLLDTRGAKTAINSGGVVPGAPLWSDNSDKLYYLGKVDNYIGAAWKGLWTWTTGAGASKLFDLPGNWTQWQLLAATNEAVLAQAGDNGQHLVYFDLGNEELFEVSGVQQWAWQGGTMVAVCPDRMIRISPGFDPKVLVRDAQDLVLLGVVNQFVFYKLEGNVMIKQLIL